MIEKKPAVHPGLLWKAIARVAASLFCAGLFFTGWLAIFLLTVKLDSTTVTVTRWLLGPVVTAAGFAAGTAISERFTRAQKAGFLRIFIWPLIGCTVGAVAVYWFGPMLIVFGMFAAGTASVIIREVVLYITQGTTRHHADRAS